MIKELFKYFLVLIIGEERLPVQIRWGCGTLKQNCRPAAILWSASYFTSLPDNIFLFAVIQVIAFP